MSGDSLPGVKRLFSVAGVLAVALSGCLGGDDRSEELQRGKQLFAEVGCGDCHTLGEAGAKGKVGPSLDAVRPDVTDVQKQVTGGGPGMPAFGKRLSSEEIASIARYVSDAAGKSLGAVTARYEPDDTRLSQCRGLEDQPCYQQAFANRVYEDGPGPALALLDRRIQADRAVATGCHRIAHAMGGAALVRFDNDIDRAFAEGTASCFSGYYHGIIEQAFAGVGEEKLAERARGICGSEELARDAFLTFQCNHGLGHGLMLHTRYDLPLALDTCDQIGQPADVQACNDGVFMENFTTFYEVSTKWRRNDDLIYPCNIVAEHRKRSCYMIVTARILSALNYNWRLAAKVCRGSEPNWVYVCFRSFGRDAISTNAYDQRVARRLCHLTKEMEPECVYSVALHLATNDRSIERAGHFCRETPAAMRTKCFAGLGVTTQLLLPTGRQRLRGCRSVTRTPNEYIACFSGQVPQLPSS